MPVKKRKVKRPRIYVYVPDKKKKRPGVHSKNASSTNTKGKQSAEYKKKYRGQGRKH